MSVEAALHELRLDSGFMRNVTAWRRLPAEPARTVPLPGDLHPLLAQALRRLNIDDLYSHQAEAWTASQAGQNWVIVTPTASGKTLCYNLPAVDALLADPTAKALYLFPTKALAQDQLAELAALQSALRASQQQDATGHLSAPLPDLLPAAYDGDTPRGQRSRIRQQARIVLTNPDMLHAGILPYHPAWSQFLASLRFVVIDELHAYRGIFGSHFANVLRRLQRLCAFYGSAPQFFCASATIANPGALAQQLIQAPVTLIANDGSPKGERHVIFYNPPVVDPDLGLRRSSTLEAEAIAGRLIAGGVQTIVFARSRLTTEVLLTYLRQRTGIPSQPPSPIGVYGGSRDTSGVMAATAAIRGYRGGYLPRERRAIERGLREGSVRGVVTTNALELGVNIGSLDAAVLTGFPGTIASTWQQAGRAGRRGSISLAILVATAGALDQYVVNHPEYFFERSPEHALINPSNLVILSSHLACALFELPFKAGERFGNLEFTEEVLAHLAEEEQVQRHGGDWFWMGEGQPAQAISLRTASPDNVVIQASASASAATSLDADLSIGGESAPVSWRVIGELEREAVPLLLYEGAVYLHEGQSYLVERLDWENGQAWVTPAEVDYYTQASSTDEVRILAVHEHASEAGVQRAYGAVQVISQAGAFRKVKLHTHETLGYGRIDLPPQVLETDAFWLAFEESLLAPLRASGQWRSDPNDYGPNWAVQRDAARARDGYRCTVCGAPELANRRHDVHHKMPFRAFGYVPGLNKAYREANRLDNLVTLCRSCHQRAEAGQRLRTGLGGLAYLLGNIAPLHLMCDARDLGVVSEAKARESGLPTITIYERIPAGIGLSQRLYDLHQELLRSGASLVAACPCPTGCPACVGPLPPELEVDINPKALTQALIQACLS